MPPVNQADTHTVSEEGTTVYSGPSPVSSQRSSQPDVWPGPAMGIGACGDTRCKQPGGGGDGGDGGGEGGGGGGGSDGGAGGSGGDDGGGCGAKQSTRRNAENTPVADAFASLEMSTRNRTRGALPGRPSPCATMALRLAADNHEPLKGAAAASVGKTSSASSLKHASLSTVAVPAGFRLG